MAFDFMQNLPLPCMPVQEMFCSRKLWYYGFNIHGIGIETSMFYIYTEDKAQGVPS